MSEATNVLRPPHAPNARAVQNKLFRRWVKVLWRLRWEPDSLPLRAELQNTWQRYLAAGGRKEPRFPEAHERIFGPPPAPTVLMSAARYSVMAGKHGDTPRFAASKLGATLLEDAPAAKDGGGKLYAYHDDAWRPDGEEFYRQEVRRLMGDHWLPKHSSETVQWIEDGAPTLDETPPLDRIRVANGILRIGRDGVKLEPHSVDPLTPVRLPVRYEPKARCPAFKKFISEALPSSDVRKIAQEAMGYALVPDNSHQKAFLAHGGGGNGKTTWVRVVCAMLGRENYSAHSLHALDEDKFALADLYGKLANVCADISSNELSSSARFRAITGGDPVQGEHKFKDSFKFIPYTRLIFSANKFPPITNPTNALFDRWIVLPFERRFRDTNDENKKLVDQLTTDEELSGVLNYALAGLLRLRRQGEFTTAAKSERALEKFRLAADMVASFVREEMTQPRFYERTEVYKRFEIWCVETSHRPMSRNQFYARVRENLGDEIKLHGEHGWRIKNGRK